MVIVFLYVYESFLQSDMRNFMKMQLHHIEEKGMIKVAERKI